MPVTEVSNLDYLIDALRLELGDTDSSSYRYLDEWLRTSLVLAVKALMPRWSDKYLVDTNNDVQRNTSKWTYTYESPPIVEIDDERPIILQALIIVKSGSLENRAWNIGSWKDAEIAVSNIEGGRQADKSLVRSIEELNKLLLEPTRRLRSAVKGDLPGYKNNPHESGADY